MHIHQLSVLQKAAHPRRGPGLAAILVLLARGKYSSAPAMSVLRGVKNALQQNSEIERDVREATANSDWSASAVLLAKIAEATNDPLGNARRVEYIWN